MKNKAFIKFILFAAVAVIAVYISYTSHLQEYFTLDSIQREIQAWGIWGPIFYIGLYLISTVFLLPITILTLGAGVFFGLWAGILIAILGDLVSALASFFFSRFLAADFVRERLNQKFPKALEFEERIARRGLIATMILRFIPVAPYTIVNLGLGLTKIKVFDYTLGTVLGVLPLTAIYVYFGDSFASLDMKAIGIAMLLMVVMYLLARKLERADEHSGDTVV